VREKQKKRPDSWVHGSCGRRKKLMARRYQGGKEGGIIDRQVRGRILKRPPKNKKKKGCIGSRESKKV